MYVVVIFYHDDSHITQTTESRVEGHVLGGHPMTGVRFETDERFFAVRVISWVIAPWINAR